MFRTRVQRLVQRAEGTVASQVAVFSPTGLEWGSEKPAVPAMFDSCRASFRSTCMSVLQGGLVVYFLEMNYLPTDCNPINSISRLLDI